MTAQNTSPGTRGGRYRFERLELGVAPTVDDASGLAAPVAMRAFGVVSRARACSTVCVPAEVRERSVVWAHSMYSRRHHRCRVRLQLRRARHADEAGELRQRRGQLM